MADEETVDDDEVGEPEELNDPDLEEMAEDDLDDEIEPGLDDDEAELVDEEEEVDAVEVPVAVVVAEEEAEDDDEDDVDVDDVEASLDEILKEKLVVADEEDEDDETPEPDDRGESSLKVLPKQPDEFVCQSCFLVKHPSQLADPKRMYCRDCV